MVPTYEYECLRCGHRFERMQPMSAPALERCPECGKAVRRLIGAGAGILVKGGNPRRGAERTCSFGATGQTCCGRTSRCDSPGCDKQKARSPDDR